MTTSNISLTYQIVFLESIFSMFKMLFEQRCSVITTLCKIHHLINSYYKIGMDIRKRKNLESIKLCKISLNLFFWCWPNYSGLEWQTWFYFCLKNIVLLSYFLSFHLLYRIMNCVKCQYRNKRIIPKIWGFAIQRIKCNTNLIYK